MRFRSRKTGGFRVFAVTGTNTVSFAIESTAAARRGLLGFALERIDPAEDQRFFLRGFKVFPSVIPQPDETTSVSTFDHPVQSLVHDDFTAKPGRAYEYRFHPLRGRPKNLDRRAAPIVIAVRTESQHDPAATHDVFFNRGVASSQAYAREFENKRPEALAPEKRARALQWLSRDLDEAMLAFVKQAKRGDGLLGCFYEFRYRPVADALRAALDRGVDVRLIVDGKENGGTGEDGAPEPPFPRAENLAMLRAAKLPRRIAALREARASDIQHNKFMVLLKGKRRRPTAVWTGSTNLSVGGIHGQTNVGHWLRDPAVAEPFARYWELLAGDPGGRKGDDRAAVRAANDAFKRAVEAILPTPARWQDVPAGTTPVFSPRRGLAPLEMYARMVDEAERLACVTLAFGINKVFKQLLADNTNLSGLAFVLLEKEDRPNPKSKTPFVAVNARNNVYKAWGSFLREPIHQWARETSAGRLGLNQHVSFIHSKFLLKDPLGDDPIVVTGSANFSDPSTDANDENMLLIRGDTRVADIYFTEFNRLFFHYYFRSVQEAAKRFEKKKPAPGQGFSLFLDETDAWTGKYAPGTLRAKRVAALAAMKGFAPD